MTDKIDWPFDAWLKIAVLQMGLSPKAFWETSLTDWFAMTQSSVPKPMSKRNLIKLEDDYAQF